MYETCTNIIPCSDHDGKATAKVGVDNSLVVEPAKSHNHYMEKPRTPREQSAFVFNKSEYLSMGWFAEFELDNADEKGIVGNKYGCVCYMSRPVPIKFENV